MTLLDLSMDSEGERRAMISEIGIVMTFYKESGKK